MNIKNFTSQAVIYKDSRAACKTRLVLPRPCSFSGKCPIKLRFLLEALSKLEFCKSFSIYNLTYPFYNYHMNIFMMALIFFALVSVMHIVFIILKKETARRVTKALVVPPLLLAYITGAQQFFFFPIPALILGWIGDLLLIRIDKKKNFQLGLAAFLLGHIFYIVTFIQILWQSGGSVNVTALLIFTPQALVLGMVVFRLIKPTREMRIPVIFYMVFLVSMGLFGFQVFLLNPGAAGLLLVSGCFSFMISDTILAYYTFRKPKISGAVLIMGFYILAQAEIILGLTAL